MTDTFIPERGGCKWMTSYEHAFITGSERSNQVVEVSCCHCSKKVPYTESWVCVAFGAHGNRLPLPSFIHCWPCTLVLDPHVAYQEAYVRDRDASSPDPLKVARQAKLDKEHAAPEQPEHRHEVIN